MNKKKVAFFTMDVESYYDTSCVKEKCPPLDSAFTCAEEIKSFTKLLEKYGARASLFLTVDFLPYCLPYLKEARVKGHQIDLHGYQHLPPLTQDVNEFRNDISRALAEIQDNFQKKPAGYRAPCFGIDQERLQIIKDEGFIFDSSSMEFKTSRNAGGLDLSDYEKINEVVYSRDGFYEIKPCISKLFGKNFPVSGGGYLRMAPWFLVKRLIRKYLRHSDAYLFYVHPFELSKKKLPLPEGLSFGEKLYINRGRKSYLRNIEKIIRMLKRRGFSIVTIEDFIRDSKS